VSLFVNGEESGDLGGKIDLVMRQARFLPLVVLGLTFFLREAEAVVPVLVGPLQALAAVLGPLLLGLAGLLLGLFRPSTFKLALKLLWSQRIAILCIAAVSIVSVILVGGLRAGAGGSPTRPEVITDSWPLFRGGPERRGAASRDHGPTSGGVNWSFASEAKTFYASPAVAGNHVYVTSAQSGVFEDSGAIYCLDADTGLALWKARPDDFRATFSSPSIHERYLVCGEGLHFTQDARVVCLDLQEQGEIVWEFRTKSHVESTPCIEDGKVYVGAGDDGVYCLDLVGTEGKPNVVWHADGERYPDVESSPVARDGNVYFGLGNRGNAVCCLDGMTGAERWRTRTPYPVFAGPALSGDEAFVSMGNGNFIDSAEVVRDREIQKLRDEGAGEDAIAEARKRLAPAGEVWCLNAADGKVKWTFRTVRTVLGCVAVAGDRVFFATRGGLVYCLSRAGREISRWDAGSPIVASPALAENHVYVVTEGGKLYGLAAESLRPVWQASLGAQGTFISSPTVARGRVFVGTPEDGLLCVGETKGRDEEAIWAGSLGGPGKGGSIDGSAIPDRGELTWSYPEPPDGSPFVGDEFIVGAPPACLGDRIYVPAASGPKHGVLCLRTDLAQQRPELVWSVKTRNPVLVSPAATKKHVCIADGVAEGTDRTLCLLDAATGKALWQKPLGTSASGRFVLGERHILVQARRDCLLALDLAGKALWELATGSLPGDPAILGGIVLVATNGPPSLRALDLQTGKELWKKVMDEEFRTGPAARGNVLYVGTNQGVAAHRVVDGERIWFADSGDPLGHLALGARHIVCVNGDSELVIVNSRGGEVLERIAGVAKSVPPLLGPNGVLFAAPSGIRSYPFVLRRSQRWMRTAWLGDVTSPMAMAGSRVYFGTDKKGLVCASARKSQ